MSPEPVSTLEVSLLCCRHAQEVCRAVVNSEQTQIAGRIAGRSLTDCGTFLDGLRDVP